MKKQRVFSTSDLDCLEKRISTSAEVAVRELRQFLDHTAAIDALAMLKFGKLGRDPLDPERHLNLVEQLNQSFTCLATIAAARWLLARHPECAPLTLNLGTTPGPDIVSECGQFVAETFAATHPRSNDKLRRDLARVRKVSALHRFVFFLSPVERRLMDDTDVTIVRLEHPGLARWAPKPA